MKTREKGGVIALFVFLTLFIILGIIIFRSLYPREIKEPVEITEQAEEYSPEEINVEKITLKNGKIYFSFRGITEKYKDFIEEELEKEGINFSEIEIPEDYEDILSPEEFEKISETGEFLEKIEGEWILASEEEILEFIKENFPEFRKETVANYMKKLLTGTKSVEGEEVDEYILLEELL